MAGVHLLVQFRILRTAERDEEGEVTYFHAPTFLSLGQTEGTTMRNSKFGRRSFALHKILLRDGGRSDGDDDTYSRVA